MPITRGLRVATGFFCRRAIRTDGACVDAVGIVPGHHLRAAGAALKLDAVLQLETRRDGPVSIEVRVVIDGTVAGSSKIQATSRPPATVGVEICGIVVPDGARTLAVDVRERRGDWLEGPRLAISQRAGGPVADPMHA